MRMSFWLSITLVLHSQEVPNTGTVDLYRDQLNRLGVTVSPGQYAGELDAAERSRLALRAPLWANPNLSAAELQAAQTALLRLTDRLAADEARAAQSSPVPWDTITPSALGLLRERIVKTDAKLAASLAEAKRLVQQPAVNPASVPPPAGRTENIALGKPTRQSSFRYLGSRGGVDGVKTGNYGFYTEAQPNAWWDVDLQRSASIAEVRIYNSRINAERARTLHVLLSQDGTTWKQVYSHDGSVFGADGQPLRIPMKDGVAARWVRVQLAESNFLHLDEIEVY